MQTDDIDAFWGVIPPPDETVEPSVSEPYSLGYNFTGTHAVVDVEGRGERRSLHGMTGGFNGAESIRWVGLDRPAECISVQVSERLRRAVADEMAAPGLVDLADVYDCEDAVLTALALRLRATGRGAWSTSALELEEVVRAALRHIAVDSFGGRLPRANAKGLDGRRLDRVVEFLDANITRRTTLEEFAAVAAMSPFRFQEAFKHSTGLTPHAFQTAWRMDRAAEMIRDGATREAAAGAIGYTPGHGFRDALRRHT
ncbi:helix-turn-helix transcriptional regulator [Jannaschia sp. Os4]|uniref:helix-turn-helix domain-containing protein n=1 Tax=Jannaschia sp. Os4 TaxID=2807617 RepID=UPI00193A8180|nr:AraC family transcriptional regulator [Jannaschia sp. Os4]MBM2578135.1 helix-turn-helix transcriptional regulator [Jannaschia sp. Os4]